MSQPTPTSAACRSAPDRAARRRRRPVRRRGALPEGRRRCSTRCAAGARPRPSRWPSSCDMTVSGARQHLTRWSSDGLAEAAEIARRAAGAAAARSSTTSPPAGDALFPKAYGELTNELLGYLADERARRRRPALRPPPRRSASRAARHRLAPKRPTLAAKVAELARILDEDGYLASLGASRGRRLPGGRAQLRHLGRGQPLRPGLHQRARLHPGRAARRRVERTQHMVEGARRCAYEIRPA